MNRVGYFSGRLLDPDFTDDIHPSCDCVGGRDEHVRSVVSGQRFDRTSLACLPQNASFRRSVLD